MRQRQRLVPIPDTIVMMEKEINFLTTSGIDPHQIHSLSDLLAAKDVACRRRSVSILRERDRTIYQALAQVREWGIGARVESPKRGRVYIVAFAKGSVGVRRFPEGGLIRFVNPETFILVKKATKKTAETIRRSMRPQKKRKFRRVA